MLDKAIDICKEKHRGQFDKGGRPYFMHPLAVSEMVDGVDAKIVACLHDVVEDTDATVEWLMEKGFSEKVVEAVDAITRRDGEQYFDYIDRVAKNELAKTVKIADLKHNLDPSRDGATEELKERYTRALSVLLGEHS